MKHEIIVHNEYKIHLDYSVEKDLKSFKEEVLAELYSLYKNEGVVDLMFSGGMDGAFILRSLMELGVKPNLHTLSFSKDGSDYDSLQAKQRCKEFGFPEPNFFVMEKEDIINHITSCTFEYQKAYPTLHCYYVDYFLSKTKDTKFYCGMTCEYRLSGDIIKMQVAPQILKHDNPNRLYGFTTSRTFLSYVNDPVFKNNYLKEPPPSLLGENLWHVRDLIYNNCYPDITIIQKNRPDDQDIANHFYNALHPLIKENYPLLFHINPFVFNVTEYFKRKQT